VFVPIASTLAALIFGCLFTIRAWQLKRLPPVKDPAWEFFFFGLIFALYAWLKMP
jgi:hypothetical protein